MTGVLVLYARVAAPLVRVDSFRVFGDGSVHEIVKRFLLGVRDDFETDSAAALDRACDPSLVALVGASLASGLSTYQSLIDLDYAEQRRPLERVVAHRLAYAVAEVPRGAVRHAQGPHHLVGGDPFLAFAHEVDGDEPLPQGQVTVMHDRSSRHRELVSTFVAVEHWPLLEFADAHGAALGARDAVRPAQVFKQLAALLVGAEVVYYV